MAEMKESSTPASRITLEDFFEVANNSVLRAIQAQKYPQNWPWPHGPIIAGIIIWPPDQTLPIPVLDAKK